MPQPTQAIQQTPTPEPQNAVPESDPEPDVEIVTQPVIIYISSGDSVPFSTTTIVGGQSPSEPTTSIPETTPVVTAQTSELPSLPAVVSSSLTTTSEEPEETITIHATMTESVTLTIPGNTVTVTEPTSEPTPTEEPVPTVSSAPAVTSTPTPQSQPKYGGMTGDVSGNGGGDGRQDDDGDENESDGDAGALSVIPITPSGFITITETQTVTEKMTETVTSFVTKA